MSKSKLSTEHKLIAAFLAAGILVGIILPLVAWAGSRRADQLANEANSLSPIQAAVLLREALILKPFDHSAIADQLADAYVALDQPDKAVGVLDKDGGADRHLRSAQIWLESGALSQAAKEIDQAQPTSAAMITKSKIELEQGNASAAIAAAQQAVSSGGGQPAQQQLALTLIVAGQGSRARTSIAAVGDSQAAQQLQAAASDYLSLARLLYATKLLNSANRVLAKQSQLNDEGYLLWAQTKIALGDTGGAKSVLQNALKQDPADLALHQLLLSVETQLGDPDAQHQRELIQELQNGKV